MNKFFIHLVLILTLIKTTATAKGCSSGAVPCHENVTVATGEDLSLTCMVDSLKGSDQQYMYCGEKGSGIHFRVTWRKEGKKVGNLASDGGRYLLENDNQTLSLVPAEPDMSGYYESVVEIFYLKKNFTESFCTYENFVADTHPYHFKDYKNYKSVTVSEKYYSGKVDKWTCTFNVLVQGNLSELEQLNSSPYPWKLSTVYIFDTEEEPSVNYRYKEGEFVEVEPRHYPWYQLKSDEQYLLKLNYEEIFTTVRYKQKAVFTCHIRTSIPLTDRIWWDWHKGSYTWNTHHNLTRNPHGETWHVTQRRWSLIVWNITDEQWGYSNLTCHISNKKGIAQVVHKVELSGFKEHELLPKIHRLQWCCLDKESKTCENRTFHEGNVIVQRVQSCKKYRFCARVSADDYDRVKITFNAIPLSCHSKKKDKKCYYEHYSIVMEGFHPRQDHFCRDSTEWWPYPAQKEPKYLYSSRCAWFWETYLYKNPAYSDNKCIWLNVTEGGSIKGPSSEIVTEIPTVALSDIVRGIGEDFKKSKHHLLYSTAGIGGLVLLFSLVFLCVFCYVWKKNVCHKYVPNYSAYKRKKLKTKKIVRINLMQNNCLYGLVGEGAENAVSYLLPKIDIQTLSPLHDGSNLVCMCDYEIPLDAKWEYPRENLQIGNIIGEGYFGLVKLAVACDTKGNKKDIVAVKMLKDTAGDNEMRCLLAEISVMKKISTGDNPNIIKLLGCCTQGGPVYAIMEYAEHGNLKNYLQELASSTGYLTPNSLQLTRKALHPITLTVNKLIHFAVQVANGMKYITSLKIVHRDLAARNVLLTEDFTLKITDFGFTRMLNNSEYYRTINQGVFPVKWMSPEAITDQKYTTKSDIWSFGILMWEIFTLGANPYPDVGCDFLLQQLLNGYRMNRPENCPVELYDYIILPCWELDPDCRPCFDAVHNQLIQLHDKQDKEIECCFPRIEAFEGMLVMPRLKSPSIDIPTSNRMGENIHRMPSAVTQEMPVTSSEKFIVRARNLTEGYAERLSSSNKDIEGDFGHSTNDEGRVSISDNGVLFSTNHSRRRVSEDFNNNVFLEMDSGNVHIGGDSNEQDGKQDVSSNVPLYPVRKLYVRFSNDDESENAFPEKFEKKHNTSSDDDNDSAVGLGSLASPSQSSMCYSPPISPSFSLNNDASEVFF